MQSVLGLTLLVLFASLVHAQDGTTVDERPAIEADVLPQAVKEADIDTENWEASLFFGVVSIEDFETPQIFGLRLAYHISDRFFAEGSVGITEAGASSFEVLDQTELLTESERSYTYYNMGVGWNILPGEAFWSDTRAFNSNLYLYGAAGTLDFAGDSRFNFTFAFGYQLLLTDWISFHLRAGERWYEIDVIGEDKTAHDFELTGAIGLFF